MWIHFYAILVILTIFVLKTPIIWLWKIYKIWKVLLPFSPEKTYWLFGIFPTFAGPTEKGVEQFLKWTAENPRYFSFLMPFRPSMVVVHPDTVKQILKTTEPKGQIPATGTGYRLLIPWIGDGLLNSKGLKWQRNRKLLTPGFHFDVLKPYIRIYNECVDKTLKHIEHEYQLHDGSVEIYQLISLCTLNIILKCAFSSQEDVQADGKESKYANAVNKLANLTMKRNVDFLDILLLARDEDGSSLIDIEIRDEVETFLFEGHDTTSSAISWALYNLARHPDIQKKVYLEIQDTLQIRQDMEWEDLNNVPYLTMCIKESMRIYPAVHNVTRELSRPLHIDGIEIPTGTVIDINILGLHHNPTVWGEDHMLYKPERFLQENISLMDPFAYLPFSAGPRNCIGQVFAMNEMKVIIGKIIQKFVIYLDEKHCVEKNPDLVLRPKYGIKLYFKKRINKT